MQLDRQRRQPHGGPAGTVRSGPWLLCAALLLFGGCTRGLWGGPSARVSDGATHADASAGFDGGAPSVDGARPKDGAVRDLTMRDAARTDASRGDAVATPTGCAPGMVATVVSGTMAFCGKGGAVSQCSAESLCDVAGGWRLCRASEYFAVFAAALPPASAFWVAGCLRADGGRILGPLVLDRVCGDCVGGVPLDASWAWSCTTKLPTNSNDPATSSSGPTTNVGIVAQRNCKRLGLNEVSTEAYWGAADVSGSQGVGGAVCCR